MSNSLFQSVVSDKKNYNNFPLSREVLVSGKIGKLIPVQCDEVVPGDIFKQSAAFLCRFAPLSAPAMARFNVHFHTFYVPFRIITPETSRDSTYEKFMKSIGKHEDEVPVLPFIFGNADGNNYFGVGSLGDYLGFPINPYLPETARVSALPFLCYQRIYQDFYRRDQIEREKVYPVDVKGINIRSKSWGNAVFDELEENQEPATIDDLMSLQTRNYERDYFTSALPEPQFGDEVAIGDGAINWVGQYDYFKDNNFQFNPTDYEASIYQQASVTSGYVADAKFVGDGSNRQFLTSDNVGSSMKISNGVMIGDAWLNGPSLASQLQGNMITINEFRLAMQLQGIKEKINRVGTRYLEIMQGIYGVRVPDARLQRPIYLGGFKNPVTIGSVMQTSESDNTPQGTLTGQMSSAGSNNLVRGGYMFREHGYLMTIMSITPRTSYYGGMPRKFMKRYPEEFYLPQFDHLGEQPIYNSELFWSKNNADGVLPHPPFDDESGDTGTINNGIFGYTPRYAEYKSSFSTVHGEFRTTLDNWHVSRDFDAVPALNPSFIKAEPEDFDRIFAFTNISGTSNEHFYMQIYLDIVAKRNMSKYSTPYTLY